MLINFLSEYWNGAFWGFTAGISVNMIGSYFWYKHVARKPVIMSQSEILAERKAAVNILNDLLMTAETAPDIKTIELAVCSANAKIFPYLKTCKTDKDCKKFYIAIGKQFAALEREDIPAFADAVSDVICIV